MTIQAYFENEVREILNFLVDNGLLQTGYETKVS